MWDLGHLTTADARFSFSLSVYIGALNLLQRGRHVKQLGYMKGLAPRSLFLLQGYRGAVTLTSDTATLLSSAMLISRRGSKRF
jgi:hypothetical protein